MQQKKTFISENYNFESQRSKAKNVDAFKSNLANCMEIVTPSFSKQNFKNCVDGPTAVLLPVLPLPPSINRHRGRPLGYVRFLITNLTLLLR